MSKLSRLLAPLIALALLSGCGASTPAHHHPSRHHPTGLGASLSIACPPGRSHMGCSVAPALSGSLPTFSTSGCKIPDVSSYQAHPNWGEAKSHICGAIFKGGEYGIDADAQYNADSLAALHVWHAMYWFVRNTGCSSEAAQIVNEAHATHVTVVVNDLETPEAAGYSGCLVPAEKAAHLIPVDYTAPGTWPGGAGFGNAPLWQAEYGPTLHPFWHPVVAWQCTDGQFGCVTPIPGVGNGDVSVDLGITKLGTPPAPSTRCYHKGWPVPASAKTLCLKVRAHDAFLGQERSREASFLKVTQSNEAAIQVKLSPLAKRLAVVEGRIAVEVSKHEWAALGVSATNAAKLSAQITPLEKQLAPLQARAKLEASRESSDNTQLQADLRKYGYHS